MPGSFLGSGDSEERPGLKELSSWLEEREINKWTSKHTKCQVAVSAVTKNKAGGGDRM